MLRCDWDDLDASARGLIEERTGPVLAARTATEGRNSQVAALLDTDLAGAVFVKGLRTEDPRVVAQEREVVINPHVRPVAPALLWHVEDAGWSLLCFEQVTGHHADYSPGSSDLPKVCDVMARLGELTCPPLAPLKRAEQRWAEYVDDPAELALLAGDILLHTDYNPYNVLINGTASLIDWAWPTRGAAFIDPACLIVRLIFAGHTPGVAEATVADLPAWMTANPAAVDVFALAFARMWAEIVDADPTPWKQQAAGAAHTWHTHRAG